MVSLGESVQKLGVGQVPPVVLVAEDEVTDQVLMREAFCAASVTCDLRFVINGEEVIEYLLRHGAFAQAHAAPTPNLILLDMHMPRKDGHEVLAELRDRELAKNIPTLVVSTSDARFDIERSRTLGAHDHLAKPDSFESLISMAIDIDQRFLQPLFAAI